MNEGRQRVRDVVERVKLAIEAGDDPIVVYCTPEEYTSLKGIVDTDFNQIVVEVFDVVPFPPPKVQVSIVFPTDKPPLHTPLSDPIQGRVI